MMLITITLLSIGLVSVYSASAVLAQNDGLPDYYFVLRQLTGGAVGLVALIVMAQIDYRHLRLFAWPVMLIVMLALLIVVIPGTESIAPMRNGARRWLDIGPMAIQPSEFAKIALIIWTAALAVKKRDKLQSLSRGLLRFGRVVRGRSADFLRALVLRRRRRFAACRAGCVRRGCTHRPLHSAGRGRYSCALAIHGSGRLSPGAYADLDATWFESGGCRLSDQPGTHTLGSGGPVGRGFRHGVQNSVSCPSLTTTSCWP